MPREVWDPDKPSAAFTPRKQPLSVKKTDPAKYAASPLLKSSTQQVRQRNPHTDGGGLGGKGIIGRPSTGITYTEPQITKDLNKAININRDRDRDDDGGGTTTPPKTGGGLTCAQKGMVDDGAGGCKAKDGTETEDGGCKSDADCGEGKECVNGKCVTKTVDDGSCPGCDTTKNDCINGKCTPKKTGGDDDGGDAPSLTTILKPDETPMLQTLTNEMDLRNMLTNVLNKNNPLFKQARTRALQAMAGRGIVNSSMAEEAVMSAVMNVAMPIATRVIDDLQRVMAANVNASNAFKQELNRAYYDELLKRVDAANNWNLQKMMESQEYARSMLTAKAGAAGVKDEKQFKRYMDMLSGATA